VSGGSYEYFYLKLDEFIEEVGNNKDNSYQRKMFLELLKQCSKACHAIEWVDSGDWIESAEIEIIEDVLRLTDATTNSGLADYKLGLIKEIVNSK